MANWFPYSGTQTAPPCFVLMITLGDKQAIYRAKAAALRRIALGLNTAQARGMVLRCADDFDEIADTMVPRGPRRFVLEPDE